MSDVAAGVTAPPTGPSATAEPACIRPARPRVSARRRRSSRSRTRRGTGSSPALLTVVPFLMLGFVVWQLAGSWLHWSDLRRLRADLHPDRASGSRSASIASSPTAASRPGPATRAVIGALGSAAIEGPMISWVADHRKHHAFSDEEGDPHSPHVGHGEGVWAQFKGFFHAHLGWLFIHTQRGSKTRFAPDLLKDPVARFIDRTFMLWAMVGLRRRRSASAWRSAARSMAGVTGLLWGGAVRIFVLHHVTYSINSLCHMFGKRDFETTDESRNLAWLAIPTFGEAWHNSHHAFPTSAVHGMKKRQIDPSAGVIWSLEKLGLAWDVVRIAPERQAAKAARPAQAAA